MNQSHLAFFAAAFAVLSGTAFAQCATGWDRLAGIPGTNDSVTCSTIWDPDGAGAAGSRVVVSGRFTVAGTVAATNIASWDPSTREWAALDGHGVASALLALPNGDLIAASQYSPFVARWDGQAWQPMTSGLNDSVYALAALSDGTLVAGGKFAGGVAAWNGTSWSTFGSGVAGSVHAMTRRANGDLVVTGRFLTAGGVSASCVAVWDGVSWQPLGLGISYGSLDVVRAIHETANGDLIVGGLFPFAGGATVVNSIARWDGTNWLPLGTGVWWPYSGGVSLSYGVTTITSDANGNIWVGGQFTVAGGLPVDGLARWDGTTWSAVGSGVDALTLAVHPNGDIFAGGEFTTGRTAAGDGVSRWDGTAWRSLTTTLDDKIQCILPTANGGVIAGGYVRHIGVMPAARIAAYDGFTWSTLASGITTTTLNTPYVEALTTMPDGSIVAGGWFDRAGGVQAGRIASWNGTTWSAMGLPLSDYVAALLVRSNGQLVAGGPFVASGTNLLWYIASWNGSSWSSLAGGMDGTVHALAEAANGDLLAGGAFAMAGGSPANRVARWDGTSWTALGAGLTGEVRELVVLPNGDVIAAATIGSGPVSIGRVSRWDGATWSQVGPDFNGGITAMLALPNGDLVVGGSFTTVGAVVVNRLARWRNGAWSGVGAGTNGAVHAIAMGTDGVLWIGGHFTQVDGRYEAYFASISTSCEPTVAVFGAGCPRAGGGNILTATTLPWVDATFRARGTGLPTNALVLALTSVTSYPQGLVPLSLAFPSPSGCDLLVNPDILGAHVTSNGMAETSMFLPGVPPLVGVTFFHQMLPIEIDGLGNWTQVTATNALQLTAGIF